MPIPVSCPCGAKFAAKDSLAGKAVKCPKCGSPIRIPEAAQATAPDRANPARSKPRKESAAEPADHIGSILDEIGMGASKTGVKCPNCGKEMTADAIVCIECGYNTKTKQQLKLDSDKEAAKRRNAIFAKQAAAAEKKDRRRKGKSSDAQGDNHTAKSGPESDFGVLEILFCIFCSVIALIVGIVYLITGNPKGGKMVAISLTVAVIEVIIQFALLAINLNAQ